MYQGLKPPDAILLASDLSKPGVSASLTSLDLSRNKIQGSGEALGDALKTNKSLKELQMVGCGLNAEDGKGLAGGLAVHASLTSLNLGGNKIQGSGQALGEALKTNKSLKELKIFACDLNAEDGKGLAGGLAVHASVTELNINANRIGNAGADAIADALKMNSPCSLKKLVVESGLEKHAGLIEACQPAVWSLCEGARLLSARC